MLDERSPIWRKSAGLATEGRPVFVQPLSLTPFDSSPSRGASGEKEKFSAMPKPPLQGATATTAASGGNREELLGQRPAGCERQRSRRWEPQPGLVERSETERLYEGKPDREPLQRRFTQVSGNIATPRGAGYLAKLEIIVDTSFQIELGQVDQLRLTRPSWNLVSMSNLVRLTNMEYISYIRYYI